MPKKAKIKHITIISNSVEIFVAFCSKYLRSWSRTHSCYQSALSAYKNRKIKQSAVIEIQFTLMPPLVSVQSTVIVILLTLMSPSVVVVSGAEEKDNC